jgi:cellulase/cellobiase CelA1
MLWQMDIEGHEWQALRELLSGDWRLLPDQISIELHWMAYDINFLSGKLSSSSSSSASSSSAAPPPPTTIIIITISVPQV